jgi:5-formyltetrahydrofolate cyclo-ligase
MQKAIQEAKQRLRMQVRADLARLSPGERAAASARARALLTQQAVWKGAQCVLFFAPLSTELDIWPLVQDALAGAKKVALPRFALETNTYDPCQIIDPSLDLQVGQFGIREPRAECLLVPPAYLDLILVPGVAFDSHGRRLGHGKGYYDLMLKGLMGTTCGVAFDPQVVGEVPVEPHDVRVNYILTPTRWIKVESEERETAGGD